MNINSTKLVYFSPTQTTKKVIEAIAETIESARVEHVDLTPPAALTRKPMEVHDELALIGSPVYAGRLPVDMIARLRRLKGNNTPAAIVVVYGNRAYEDALRELRDLALEIGFRPVAGGAFIAEHSYSTAAVPVAAGRPDGDDLMRAREFGKTINEKMSSLTTDGGTLPLQVPGNFPYKERAGLVNVAPVTDHTVCTRCEKCIPVCPTAAITLQDTVTTDPGMCIRCCACIKICPEGARSMEDPRIKQVAENLSRNCRARKEPEIYF